MLKQGVAQENYLVLRLCLSTTFLWPVEKGLESGSHTEGCRPLILLAPPCCCLIVCMINPGRTPVESNCVRVRAIKVISLRVRKQGTTNVVIPFALLMMVHMPHTASSALFSPGGSNGLALGAFWPR